MHFKHKMVSPPYPWVPHLQIQPWKKNIREKEIAFVLDMNKLFSCHSRA
jgi:hypothetical protein